MGDLYKRGGILEVLHSGNTGDGKITDTSDSESEEDEENQNSNGLKNLFMAAPEKKTSIGRVVDNERNLLHETLVKIPNEEDTVMKLETILKKSEGELPEKPKKKKQKESPERLERTLFVGNIALNVTRKVLKKIFIQFGEVESLRFRSFAAADVKVPKKVAMITKDFHSECKSMNAYIVYKSKESIGKALKSNGMVLEGLHLRVDTAVPEKQNKNKQALFVGNLPFNLTEELFYKHFEQCGEIDYVRLIRDKATGMGKGFGYVTFKKSDGIVFGLKMNGSKLDGRSIRVNRYESAPKNVQNSRNRKPNQKNFCGLKSTTSQKDRIKGKKLVQEKLRTTSNAMRRIKNKTGAKKKTKNVKYNSKTSRKK